MSCEPVISTPLNSCSAGSSLCGIGDVGMSPAATVTAASVALQPWSDTLEALGELQGERARVEVR